MKTPGSARDPLWFKDAVIYEIHVKAFFDGNNDGIGDFPGLYPEARLSARPGRHLPVAAAVLSVAAAGRRLRHQPTTGVSPSQLRHAGGFQNFLNAAHDRGMQVMIELVVNHTSDQHPWFQAARAAAPGSQERDFYVWSDTDHKVRRTPGSSLPTRKNPTGPGTRWPRRTTGTASSRISRI